MTWSPNPTVTIGGTDFTANAVGQVTINRGRRTVYERANAGFASLELLDVNGLGSFQVGDVVHVTVDDSAGTAVKVFTGFLSDWSSRTVATGGVPLVRYQVQAVGPLARLNRRQVLAAGRPSEDDGDRVLAAVSSGLAASWEEVGFDVSWSSVDTSFETFDGFDTALIDPGVYTLAALGSADGGYNALQVAQDAGFSGEGVLFETADGRIGYADADRRAANEVAGFLDIPTGQLAVDGLGVSQQLADITNRVTVEFDGGAVTDDDAFSIVQFGLFESQIKTDLVNQSNAEARASDFLFTHAAPQDVLDGLNINLLAVGTALRDALLDVNTNDAVSLSQVPSKVGFTRFEGFVEGLSLSVDSFRADLSLIVSDKSLSVGSIRFGQVGGTVTWDSVGTAVAWSDARSL